MLFRHEVVGLDLIASIRSQSDPGVGPMSSSITSVGAGTSNAQSLHRNEAVSVREEVEAAGFILDVESTMFAIRTRSRSSIPRSRARPIASPIGS